MSYHQIEMFPERKIPADADRCPKCSGTGEYVWGAIINGVPTNRGKCFACEGKGFQTSADAQRNEIYWNNYAVIE